MPVDLTVVRPSIRRYRCFPLTQVALGCSRTLRFGEFVLRFSNSLIEADVSISDSFNKLHILFWSTMVHELYILYLCERFLKRPPALDSDEILVPDVNKQTNLEGLSLKKEKREW